MCCHYAGFCQGASTIISAWNQKCIHVSPAADGTQLTLWDCSSVDAPTLWIRHGAALQLATASAGPALCMHLEGNSYAEGAWVTVRPCDGSAAQRWLYDRLGGLHPEAFRSKCLEVRYAGTSNGARLVSATCLPGPDMAHQGWTAVQPGESDLEV